MLSDSTIFILGDGAAFIHTGREEIGWIVVNKDGSQVLNKHIIRNDSITYYIGEPGAMKKLPSAGYIVPVTEVFAHNNYVKYCAGLLKLNAQLDTIFLRTYTDTSLNDDYINTCTIMPDGTYLIGGTRGIQPDSCVLMHIDSNGNLLWVKTYANIFLGENYTIRTLSTMPNGLIIAGAYILNQKVIGMQQFYYDLKSPWFILFDTSGNIIKDTVYRTHYGGGEINIDTVGGYVTWGYLDSFFTSNPNQAPNLPGFIAHLDDSFRMTWVTNFADNYTLYDIYCVRQLHDGNYLVIGDRYGYMGWLAKVNAVTGAKIWEHIYGDSTLGFAYFADVIEKSNGNFLITGSILNPNEPNNFRQDVWLLEVDSNGCEVPGCMQTTGTPPSPLKGELKIWPNPVNNFLNIEASFKIEQIEIVNTLGQSVLHKICSTERESIDISHLRSGMYFMRINNLYTQKVMKQ